MRHLDIAPCDCRTSQGATRQLRTLRHPHIAPCDIALSHPATFACRTLQLKNPAFDPKITPNRQPYDAYYIRSAREAHDFRRCKKALASRVPFGPKKHVRKAEKVSMDGNAKAHQIKTRRCIGLKRQLPSDASCRVHPIENRVCIGWEFACALVGIKTPPRDVPKPTHISQSASLRTHCGTRAAEKESMQKSQYATVSAPFSVLKARRGQGHPQGQCENIVLAQTLDLPQPINPSRHAVS